MEGHKKDNRIYLCYEEMTFKLLYQKILQNDKYLKHLQNITTLVSKVYVDDMTHRFKILTLTTQTLLLKLAMKDFGSKVESQRKLEFIVRQILSQKIKTCIQLNLAWDYLTTLPEGKEEIDVEIFNKRCGIDFECSDDFLINEIRILHADSPEVFVGSRMCRYKIIDAILKRNPWLNRVIVFEGVQRFFHR